MRRSGVPLTVMMIDVDDFKRVNDVHGHAEGDRALRVIARALMRVARASDIVCRYGGEEFCIILAGTPLEAAAQLAGRVRDEIPAACVREDIAGGARITVTVGLAVCPEDGVEADTLLTAADRRMYRGKGGGRDRVVTS